MSELKRLVCGRDDCREYHLSPPFNHGGQCRKCGVGVLGWPQPKEAAAICTCNAGIRPGAIHSYECALALQFRSRTPDVHLPRPDLVEAPAHYGGVADPYEAIKVIEAWGLGFNEGNALKYIKRGEDKDGKRQDLMKAIWYLKREVWILDGAPGEFERETKIYRDEPTEVKP